MVAFRPPARVAGLLLAGNALVACQSGGLPKPGGPAASVRTPAAARAAAQSLGDALAAADTAWAAGNDRGYAQKRLLAAVSKQPFDAAAQLRLGVLALTNLDMAAATDHLSRAVIAEPNRPEAGAALVFLHSWKSELAADARTLVTRLTKSGLLRPETRHHPFHRALTTALLMPLDESPPNATLREVGGWLPIARVAGPLGPIHDRVLTEPMRLEDAVDWRARPTFRGVLPPVRTVHASGTALAVASGGRRGSYLLQAFFRVDQTREGLVQARLPGFARLKIDGFTVLERDPAAVRPPGLMVRRVRLEAGWHRLTALVTAASAANGVAISMLDDNGRPLAAEVQAEPPSAPLTVGRPDIQDASIAAVGQGHPYWLAAPRRWAPEQALFGRLLASVTALSPWLDDLEAGRAYLFGLDEAAPESAAVHASLARLASWAGLPDNLVQVHLREALSKDPSYVGVLVGLGRRVQRRDPTRALELADRAIRLAPNAFAPRALAYRVYRTKEWHAEATAALRRAADLGAPASVLLDGSRYLRNSGLITAADEMEAVAFGRAGSRRRLLQARRAARRGALPKAIDLLAKDRSVRNRIQRAEWSLAIGDFDSALDTARTVLVDDPLMTRASRLVALAQAAKGDQTAARTTLTRLREKGQTSPSQEALAESFGGPALAGPAPNSWLGQNLRFDPRPLVAPLPGSRRPRGLDASDRWAGHGQVQLLNRVVDRVNRDGSSISVQHGVIRLQTKEATDRAGEINLPADALALSLRTLKPDGSTVDVDRHAGKDALSFSALAPGDAIERKWVTVEGAASPWGGYVRRFFFKSTSPIVRSELAVVVPRDSKVRFFTYHGAPQPTVHDEGDTVVYYWRADNIPAVVPEPQSPHPTEYVPFVVMTVDIDRDVALATVSRNVRTLTRGSYGVERAAARAVSGTTPAEQVKAIFDWVVKNIEHGSAADPAQVLARGRGDRTGLFAAMLQAANLPATIVQARSGRAAVVAPSYPNTTDFAATLVRIELSDQRTLWADMDRPSPWLGRLPPWYHSGHYLARSDEGRPVVRPIPDRDLAQWPIQSELVLSVRDNGDASGTLKLELPGTLGLDLSRILSTARPEDRQRQMQRWLVSIMPSAQLQNLDIPKRTEPLAPFVMTASVAVPGFMSPDRDHLVAERFFSEPLVGNAFGQPGLRAYVRLTRRTAPMILVPTFEKSTVTVQFPKSVGRPVETPRSFRRSAEFGSIEQTFEWDDAQKRARLQRSRLVPLRRIQPTDFPAFRDNAQTVLQVGQNRLIVPLAAPVRTASNREAPK